MADSRLINFIESLKIRLDLCRYTLFNTFSDRSYAQEGEDMILKRIFGNRKMGFYVDVGAHHPQRFSNTYYFFRRGWIGINIEPNPDMISMFRIGRKRDINLQLGVSSNSGVSTYHHFNDPALNGFDPELVKWRTANTPYKLVKTQEIPVERLETILDRYLPVNVQIDFLTVDVEGLDFAVLKSNNWAKYRPRCVLVEALATNLSELLSSEIYVFMKQNGYELFAKTYNTLIFTELACSNSPTEC